tara:strand:- start:801 stop:1013 length:213 start_codon:yes stop_codon:yes gene_type:complete
MRKILFLLIIIIYSTSCSMDTQSGLWNKKINELQLSNIKVDDIDKNISFKEYKDIVIKYGIYSDFPNINN